MCVASCKTSWMSPCHPAKTKISGRDQDISVNMSGRDQGRDIPVNMQIWFWSWPDKFGELKAVREVFLSSFPRSSHGLDLGQAGERSTHP